MKSTFKFHINRTLEALMILIGGIVLFVVGVFRLVIEVIYFIGAILFTLVVGWFYKRYDEWTPIYKSL